MIVAIASFKFRIVFPFLKVIDNDIGSPLICDVKLSEKLQLDPDLTRA